MRFNSDANRTASVAVALVNGLSGAEAHGRAFAPPSDDATVFEIVSDALIAHEYAAPTLASEALALASWAVRVRTVFERAAAGDLSACAAACNDLLRASNARPHLVVEDDGTARLHFHAKNDTFIDGWRAGIAAGLARTLGDGQVLGVCEAARCDRVWIDGSRNRHRRFCSLRCQNRVKAAAHRGRATHAAHPPA